MFLVPMRGPMLGPMRETMLEPVRETDRPSLVGARTGFFRSFAVIPFFFGAAAHAVRHNLAEHRTFA
jgi:hypothetical protein